VLPSFRVNSAKSLNNPGLFIRTACFEIKIGSTREKEEDHARINFETSAIFLFEVFRSQPQASRHNRRNWVRVGERWATTRGLTRNEFVLPPVFSLQAWEVARTVVAQPPIAATWSGRVFRLCVRLCLSGPVVCFVCVRLCGGPCVVRVTCVLFSIFPQDSVVVGRRSRVNPKQSPEGEYWREDQYICIEIQPSG